MCGGGGILSLSFSLRQHVWRSSTFPRTGLLQLSNNILHVVELLAVCWTMYISRFNSALTRFPKYSWWLGVIFILFFASICNFNFWWASQMTIYTFDHDDRFTKEWGGGGEAIKWSLRLWFFMQVTARTLTDHHIRHLLSQVNLLMVNSCNYFWVIFELGGHFTEVFQWLQHLLLSPGTSVSLTCAF